jgi:hypothetical protein
MLKRQGQAKAWKNRQLVHASKPHAVEIKDVVAVVKITHAEVEI